jgi:choline kinase
MKAVVLAAGEGTRLRPYTDDRPKCLVELGGEPLLRIQIGALRAAGVDDVTVIVGYRAEQVERLGYPTLRNPEYATTNMVATLMCADRLLDGRDDVLVAYGDLLYEPRLVGALAACTEPLATIVDLDWLRLWRLRSSDPLADAETLRMSEAGDIVELGRRPSTLEEIQGQYIGLTKVRADFAPELVAAYRALDPDRLYDGRAPARMFMTSFLQHLIDTGRPVRSVPVRGGWLEVDTASDLDVYSALLRDGRLAEFCRIDAEAGSGGAG